MERIREFGVMLALGTAPSKLVTIIVLEGAILGVLSVGLGVALGLLASWPLITQGLDFAAMMGENLEMGGVTLDSRVYAAIDWERLIIYSAAGVVMTMLATLYPALKAARLRPVESMRHV
jgi:ABC-type lipoprotein release transport system permease subunit